MALYRATKGAGFSDKEAQRIGDHLEGLGDKFGPADIVESARAPESPIHQRFTWDDEKAGESWRLHEARQLVNHLAIVVKINGEKQETKAFYSVNVRIAELDTVEPRYVKVTTAIQNKAIQRTILDDLIDDLNSITRKYNQFRSIVGGDVFEAIEATVKKFEQKGSRARALKGIAAIQTQA